MRSKAIHAALWSAAALCAPPAAAEETQDVIIVTAAPAPTPLSRLPARAEHIGRAEIEALSLPTLASAIGPQAVQAGGTGQQASLFLRGANSKHALALLDGVRLNDASTPNAQYDFGQDTLGALEAVEIVRGPASAIYGSDAIGGVVNMLPRRGGDSAFAPFLEASGGSLNMRAGALGATGGAGGFEYGVTAEAFLTDGHDLVPARMTTHGGHADGARIETLTASGRYEAGVFAFDALARTRRSETEFDTFSGGPLFDLRSDDPDLRAKGTQNIWRLGGEMEAGAALTFRLSGGQTLSDRAEIDGGFTSSDAESTRDFADLSARYVSGPLALNAGLSRERDSIETQPQFANALAVAETQTAAYIAGQYQLAPGLTASGAVRVDEYESFGAHTSFSLGAVREFGNLRLYVSYGEAFKAPSLSERFETGFFNIGNRDLRPETSRSWELGGDWRANAFFEFGATYFNTRIEDLIEYDFAALQNINIGEARIEGAEVYAQFSPAAWATLRASHGWTDAENGDTGAQLARRPEQTWRIDARLRPHERLALALIWDFIGERTDVTYADGGQFLSGSGRVESYTVGALSATYDVDEHAQVFLRVDNVADESYEQPAAFAGAPRAAAFGVRVRF